LIIIPLFGFQESHLHYSSSNNALTSMAQLDDNTGFILEKKIEIWIRMLKSEPSVTEKDTEELKTHLLDLIDQLKEKGLDDEEAFLVASKRMGTLSELGNDFLEANNPILQIRRSVLILGGVLVYFLLFHFIESSSKLMLIVSIYGGLDAFTGSQWVYRYMIGWHLIVILFVVSIYFFENKVINFIENVRLKPKHTIFLLLTTFFLAILNISGTPIIRNMVNKDRFIISYLITHYRDFGYTFPLIVCIGFIIIYFKYYKIAKF
jgi:hypothetical protein